MITLFWLRSRMPWPIAIEPITNAIAIRPNPPSNGMRSRTGRRLPGGVRRKFCHPEPAAITVLMADYPDHALEAGTQAPDFHLKATPDPWVGLDDFHGNALIMAFYPADWSPVCTDQMALYNEILPDRKSTRLNSSHRCISYAVFC